MVNIGGTLCIRDLSPPAVRTRRLGDAQRQISFVLDSVMKVSPCNALAISGGDEIPASDCQGAKSIRSCVYRLRFMASSAERPKKAFVAQFVGENNQLHGQVVERHGEQVTVQFENDVRIKAHAVDNLSAGERVEISLRPEREPRLRAERVALLDPDRRDEEKEPADADWCRTVKLVSVTENAAN